MGRYTSDELRVLHAHGLTEEEWAVLFTASYHTPLPREQLLELAAEEVTGIDVRPAFERCVERGWLTLWDSVCRGQGVILSEQGRRVKDSVSKELMATVLRGPLMTARAS